MSHQVLSASGAEKLLTSPAPTQEKAYLGTQAQADNKSSPDARIRELEQLNEEVNKTQSKVDELLRKLGISDVAASTLEPETAPAEIPVPAGPFPATVTVDERPTVETTPSGVLIMRGQPSHRFGN